MGEVARESTEDEEVLSVEDPLGEETTVGRGGVGVGTAVGSEDTSRSRLGGLAEEARLNETWRVCVARLTTACWSLLRALVICAGRGRDCERCGLISLLRVEILRRRGGEAATGTFRLFTEAVGLPRRIEVMHSDIKLCG